LGFKFRFVEKDQVEHGYMCDGMDTGTK